MGLMLIGAAAMLFLMLFFVLGIIFGAKMTKHTPHAAEPSEADLQRFREDQAAFESLLSFSPDVVYGVNNGLGGDRV